MEGRSQKTDGISGIAPRAPELNRFLAPDWPAAGLAGRRAKRDAAKGTLLEAIRKEYVEKQQLSRSDSVIELRWRVGRC